MTHKTFHSDVVHIVQRLAPGGIETLVLDLVASDPSRGAILSLEGTVDELVAAWPALASIKDRIVAANRKPGLSIGLVWQLSQILRGIAPSTVFCHHIGPLIYGGAAARLAGIERVVHVEHDVWHYDTPRHRFITSGLERAVKPLHVAVSHHAAGEIKAFLPSADVTVIHNGIDLERFSPGDKIAARARYGIPQDRRIVGTAGRLVEVKGQDMLISAAAYLPSDVHVVIAGSGPCRPALEALARGLGISHRVQFLGHVDGVETVLPAFDVFCLPSHAEGFPRSAIEAQAVGIPVVATKVGALREAICPETGKLVTAGDPYALAHALKQALAQPSKSPRAFVEQRFSWQQTLGSYRRMSEARHAA
jgi:glycosyltransferase involved in cell wall biosynthesis